MFDFLFGFPTFISHTAIFNDCDLFATGIPLRMFRAAPHFTTAQGRFADGPTDGAPAPRHPPDRECAQSPIVVR
jgi:hypothetical protein